MVEVKHYACLVVPSEEQTLGGYLDLLKTAEAHKIPREALVGIVPGGLEFNWSTKEGLVDWGFEETRSGKDTPDQRPAPAAKRPPKGRLPHGTAASSVV